MLGTWRWNAVTGSLSLVFTFLISLSNNVPMTALIRSLYGFIVVFAITYVIRWMLGTLAGINMYSAKDFSEVSDAESAGASIDYQTPDEFNTLNDLLKNQLRTDVKSDFSPLEPP